MDSARSVNPPRLVICMLDTAASVGLEHLAKALHSFSMISSAGSVSAGKGALFAGGVYETFPLIFLPRWVGWSGRVGNLMRSIMTSLSTRRFDASLL